MNLLLSHYISVEDYNKIILAIKKALFDFSNSNARFDSLVSDKVLQKNRHNNAGIILVNQYILKLELTNYQAEIKDCGRYKETWIIGKSNIVVFKNSNSGITYAEVYRPENINKAILCACVDFKKNIIFFKAFINGELKDVFNDYDN